VWAENRRAGCRHHHPCQEKPRRHQTGRLCRLDWGQGKDGKIHAIEARIFPKAAPDGGRQFAWDLMPDSVMTNATVGTVTKAAQGAVLHVTFTGGESDSIGPDVPILANAPGNMSLLKPGAVVFVVALKKRSATSDRRSQSSSAACPLDSGRSASVHHWSIV
jgi:hypothetical protein